MGNVRVMDSEWCRHTCFFGRQTKRDPFWRDFLGMMAMERHFWCGSRRCPLWCCFFLMGETFLHFDMTKFKSALVSFAGCFKSSEKLFVIMFPKISNPRFFVRHILCSSALLAHCWDEGVIRTGKHSINWGQSYAWEKMERFGQSQNDTKRHNWNWESQILVSKAFGFVWILQSQATMMMKNFNGVCTPKNLKFSGKKVPMTQSPWRVNHWSKSWTVHQRLVIYLEDHPS